MTDGEFITPKQATDEQAPTRRVVIDGVEYRVQLKASSERADKRFDAPCYAVVQLPGRWNAVVPVAAAIQDVDHLWHRELVDAIERARLYVNMRDRH